MKKIIITTLILFAVGTSVAYAKVTDNSSDYGLKTGGSDPSTYFQYTKKTPEMLTKDVRDLQSQIDQLNRKNGELEAKLLKYNVPEVHEASTASDIQTIRIDAIEKRVGILEELMNTIKSMLDRTLGLLNRLIDLL